MGRTSAALLPKVLFVLGALGCAPWAQRAWAESDYEFVKGLMEKNSPSFGTEDLVERVIAQLEASPATQLEGVLAKAAYRRRQAEGCSTEKRKALLEEADNLYKEFMAKGTKHRLFGLFERESATLVNDMLKSQVRAARELSKTDPAKAKAVYLEAAATVEKIASGQKAVADAALPKFLEVFKRKEAVEKADETGEKPLPRDLVLALDKTFNEWIHADKRYVSTKVDQLECYDDADPEKKTRAADLNKVCEERIADKSIESFPIVGAWYAFMQGRINALVQNEAKAGEAWENALKMVEDVGNLNPDQLKQLLLIKRLILHDLVKMKMKGKKYANVVDIMENSFLDITLKPLFNEDGGKDLLIDYARAHALAPDAGVGDVKKAIETLKDLIEKENAPGGNRGWADHFSLVMSDILRDAKARNLRPSLSAREWYDAARGYCMRGQTSHKKFTELEKESPEQAKVQLEESFEQFQNAIDYYRMAVSSSRNDKGNMLARLTVEPKAWEEMGLVYIQMQQLLEALIAYQAMASTFKPDVRKKWMPAPEALEVGRREYSKAILEAIASLDRPKDGYLAKAFNRINLALNKYSATHKSTWDKTLTPTILAFWKDSLDDSMDVDFMTAKTVLDMAKANAEVAKAERDPKIAAENYNQAQAKYADAADKFMKIKPTSVAYESALCQAGSSFVQAQSIWSSGKVSGPKEEVLAKVKDFTVKALEAFRLYEEQVARKPVVPDDEKEQRQKLAGAVLQARSSLLLGNREWEKAVKAADEYLAWTQTIAAPAGTIETAYLNKFRALLEQAALLPAPQCDPLLKEAHAVMGLWRTANPKDKSALDFMLSSLAKRNLVAVLQTEKAKMAPEIIENYENAFADLQTQRMALFESSDSEMSLEEYMQILYLLHKTRRERQATDLAAKVIKKFDPENKGMRLPEDEVFWKAMLNKMHSLIKFDDFSKQDMCKADHMALVDFMYDTREGKIYEATPDKRPAYDKYNVDLGKAREKIGTIKRNFPSCKTLLAQHGKDGNSYLGIIEDEVEFRRKIEFARDLLSSLALKVAAKLQKEAGQEEAARTYREIASDQIKVLMKLKGENPATQIKLAEIDISIGKFKEALEMLEKVRNAEEDRASLAYFDASRKIAEVLALQKKWKEAVEFPEYMAIAAGFDNMRIKEYWPDMKLFLLDCYGNGVPMPAELKALLTKKPNLEPKGEKPPKTEVPTKTEEPKKTTEGAKTEEPKKTTEGAKTEEPKKTSEGTKTGEVDKD